MKEVASWLAASSLMTCLVACASDDVTGPRAPELVELAPMAGSLHVTWKNVEPTCDSIELERKEVARTDPPPASASTFAVVYVLPGAVDNKHDGTATGDAIYTYRLRCKKGSAYSGYSNEMSASP